MPSRIYQFVRRHLRALKRAQSYPILLPHFTVSDDEVRGVDGSRAPISPALAKALRLSDGSRRLSAVAKSSGATVEDLLQQYDQGRIILWKERIEEPFAPEDRFHTIVMSPHPDDAALSAFSESQDHANFFLGFHVVNVFSRTAWWRFPDRQGDVAEIQRVREMEEKFVSRLMRARLKMLDLPEALLRGYDMDEVFRPPVPARDAPVEAAIVAAIKELVQLQPGWWLLPLGVGGHVDHLVVREFSLAALEESVVPLESIMFYEDLPYAADVSEGTPDFSDVIIGRRLRVCSNNPVGDEKLQCLRAY